MYNVHTLVMTPKAILKLTAVYIRVLRRIAGRCRFQAAGNVTDSALLKELSKPSMDCLLVRARLRYLRRVCKHSSQALFLLLTLRKGRKPLPWVTQIISDLHLLKKSVRYHKGRMPGLNAELHEWLALFEDQSAWNEAVDRIFFTHSCNDKFSSSGQQCVKNYVCDLCAPGPDGSRPAWASQRALESHKRTKHKQLSDMRYYVRADGVCPVCSTAFQSRIRCLAHLSDRRRTKCSDRIRNEQFARIDLATVNELDLADRIARRSAQRSGHSHPIAQGHAVRAGGRVVGRVSL